MLKQRMERVYLDGTPLTQLIEVFQDAVKRFGSSVFFSSEISDEYGHEYIEMCFVYETEETPEEQGRRVIREKMLADQRLDSDRKQYENLKKKFEGQQ